MRCDECDVKLLDLVEGLLDEGEAAAVRAHVATCATCGPAFTQLSESHRAMLSLPLAEPSARVDNAILAMARAKAAGQAVVVPREPVREAAPADSWWERWLKALGGFATGPQAAMATVMLLVLAIGVWYLPRGGDGSSFGESVLHPTSSEEAPAAAAPSPTLKSVREAEPSTATLQGEVPAAEGAFAKGEQEAARQQALAQYREMSAKDSAAPRASRAKMGGMKSSSARADDDPLAGLGGDLPPADADRTESKKLARGVQGSLDKFDDSDDALGSGAANTASSAAESAQAPASVATAPAPAPKADGRMASPAALLSRARAAAADGDCKTAVAQYAALVSRFPDHGGRAQALREQANCYEKLGQLAMAQKARLQAEETSSPAKRKKAASISTDF